MIANFNNFLNEKQQNITILDDYFLQSLHNGDISILKKFIKNGGNLKSYRDGTGDNILVNYIFYCRDLKNFKEIVKLMLDNGVDIHNKNKNTHLPALQTCAISLYEHYKEEHIQFLLDNGADINEQDHDGKTILIYAARRNNTNLIKILINKGADIFIKDDNGDDFYTIAGGNTKKFIEKICPEFAAAKDFGLLDESKKEYRYYITIFANNNETLYYASKTVLARCAFTNNINDYLYDVKFFDTRDAANKYTKEKWKNALHVDGLLKLFVFKIEKIEKYLVTASEFGLLDESKQSVSKLNIDTTINDMIKNYKDIKIENVALNYFDSDNIILRIRIIYKNEIFNMLFQHVSQHYNFILFGDSSYFPVNDYLGDHKTRISELKNKVIKLIFDNNEFSVVLIKNIKYFEKYIPAKIKKKYDYLFKATDFGMLDESKKEDVLYYILITNTKNDNQFYASLSRLIGRAKNNNIDNHLNDVKFFNTHKKANGYIYDTWTEHMINYEEYKFEVKEYPKYLLKANEFGLLDESKEEDEYVYYLICISLQQDYHFAYSKEGINFISVEKMMNIINSNNSHEIIDMIKKRDIQLFDDYKEVNTIKNKMEKLNDPESFSFEIKKLPKYILKANEFDLLD